MECEKRGSLHFIGQYAGHTQIEKRMLGNSLVGGLAFSFIRKQKTILTLMRLDGIGLAECKN